MGWKKFILSISILLIFSVDVVANSVTAPPETENDEIYESIASKALQGQNDEALEEALMAIGEGIQDARIYNITGEIYNFKGMFEEAIPYLEDALSLDNSFAYAHYNLAFANHSIGFRSKDRERFNFAISNYEKFFLTYDSSQVAPQVYSTDIYDANMNMGYAHYELKDYEGAVHYFKRAVDLKPFDSRARLALSYVQGSMGRFKNAYIILHPLIITPCRYGIPICRRTNVYAGYYRNYYNSITHYYNYLGYRRYGRRWRGPCVRYYDYRVLRKYLDGPYFRWWGHGRYSYPGRHRYRHRYYRRHRPYRYRGPWRRYRRW